MEWEMCQYLDWELNVEPLTIRSSRIWHFAGLGPYPMYILRTILKSANPFPAIANTSTFKDMALCWPGTVPHVHPANNIEVGRHIGQPLPRHCQHKYKSYPTNEIIHRPTPSPPSPTQVQVLAPAKRRWLSTNEIIRQDSYTNNTGCIRKTTRL